MVVIKNMLGLVIAASIFFSVLAYSNRLPTPNSEPLPTYQKTKNTDTVLTEKVQKRIRQNKTLKDQPVSAASHQGIITLQGSVKTAAQEKAAIQTAKSVPGVKAVKSQLSIGDHG